MTGPRGSTWDFFLKRMKRDLFFTTYNTDVLILVPLALLAVFMILTASLHWPGVGCLRAHKPRQASADDDDDEHAGQTHALPLELELELGPSDYGHATATSDLTVRSDSALSLQMSWSWTRYGMLRTLVFDIIKFYYHQGTFFSIIIKVR